MVAVPDPWEELAATDLILDRAPIAQLGRYYHYRRAIVIRSGLLVVEERAVLWHELVHADRGDTTPCPALEGKQEASCTREAARRAIPFTSLVEAHRGAHCRAEVADALKTTEALLQVRLDGLHPAERAALRRQTEWMEWVA